MNRRQGVPFLLDDHLLIAIENEGAETRLGARYASVADFEDGEWIFYGDAAHKILVAWMPTPEPYEEEKDLDGLPLFS